MAILINEANEFWNWFLVAADTLETLLRNEQADELAELLDSRINSLVPGCTWELGPEPDSSIFLVISPNGDRSRLILTKSVVSCAPVIAGWKFYWAKPPKMWELRFLASDDKGQKIWIDAQNWRYSLTAYSNHLFFDVVIYADCALPIDSENMRNNIGIILLEGILGEELVMECIGRIEMHGFDEVVSRNTGAVRQLRSHLQSLRNKGVV